VLKARLQDPFIFLFTTFLIYIAYAFIIDTPYQIYNGLIAIIMAPDVLMTDYIYIGGQGAALVNAAIVGIACVILMEVFKCERKGLNIMAIWLMVGFAFFGKNIVNATPILLGAYLYSLYHKKPFKENIAVGMLSTALSPITTQTQIAFLGITNEIISVFIALAMGIFIGFIMIPLSAWTKKAHEGYNLYNVGFSAGITSILAASVFRNSGIPVQTVSFWSYGNNYNMFAFSMIMGLYLILCPIMLNINGVRNKFRDFVKKDFSTHLKEYISNVKVLEDIYTKSGEESYINMGLMGIYATLVVIIAGGDLNGPVIGGIFTIIGFSCLGKKVYNVAPPMIGCALVIFLNGWDISASGNLITLLFSAALAPIASAFGIFWGIIAGMLHINLAVTFADVHGGLNLYNNGAVAGFIAIFLVPIIKGLKRE